MSIPPGAVQLVKAVGSNPFGVSANQTFPVVGLTTVNWGLGTGAYLFVVGAVIMIIAALVLRGRPTMGSAESAPDVPQPKGTAVSKP